MTIYPTASKLSARPGFDSYPSPLDKQDCAETFEEVLAAAMKSLPPLPDAPQLPAAPAEHAEIPQVKPPLQPVAARIADPHSERGETREVPIARTREGTELLLPVIDAVPDYRPTGENGTPAAIGEDAVRFDARAIIAQTAMAALLAPLELPEAPSSVPAPGAGDDGATFELVLQRPADSARRGLHLQAVAPGSASPARPMAQRYWSEAARALGTVAGPLLGLRARVSETPHVDIPAAPVVRSAGRNGEVRAPVQLTISASEVLVTVRGVELSTSEQAALLQEVRRLVAKSHFGERTVRLVTSRRS